MNNENQNIQSQNPEEVVEVKMFQTSSSKKMNDTTRVGLILQIVGASFGILSVLIFTIVVANNGSTNIGWWSWGSPWVWGTRWIWRRMPEELGLTIETIRVLILVFMWLIVIPGSISCIVMASLALHKQKDGIIIAAGVLGIIFGGFLGGIVTLGGYHEQKEKLKRQRN